MAITKSILKLTHLDAVVKIVNDTAGAASVTIDLQTDLLKSNETLSGGPIDVRMSDVTYGLGASGGSIVRNGVNVMELPPNNHGMFGHEFAADPTQKDQDLVVTIDKGTVMIRLLKVNGYLQNFRPEQGVNN